jgi:hypothetical protein
LVNFARKANQKGVMEQWLKGIMAQHLCAIAPFLLPLPD